MAGQTEFLQAIQELNGLERQTAISYLWKKSILIFLT